MRARRTMYGVALACGFGAIMAGCRDVASPNQPGAPDQASASALMFSFSNTDVFTYSPAQAASFTLGDEHRIDFPAGAVCDPLTSGYGVAEWDQPCTPLTAPISIT